MSVVAVYAMSLSMEIFEFILTYVKVLKPLTCLHSGIQH